MIGAALAAAVAVDTAGAATEARREQAKAPQVRVMTYNVRYSAGDRKSKDNNWGARRDDFASLIERENPDVIGFQEVLPDQRKWLEGRFHGYTFVGEGRNADRVNGEASPVAFRRDRFVAVTNGTFWLSKTPDVPGSKSWGTAIQRICTYAVLRDKATGTTFSFANTHTDHKSEEAREKGMLLIIERMKTFGKGAPVVFVGDHNCLEYEKPAVAVSKLLTDAIYLAKEPQGSWRTFNFWSWHENEVTIKEALKKPIRQRSVPGDQSDMKRIDYIYVSPGTTVLDYRTVSEPRPGTKLYPSDHFPSVATLVFQKF
ncbi:MAG: endonuclease/exonuclease/phosphatase family protein [Kiritimatiellae bacterium]|nr:endonuclease/exonuclease/phosphatase family protein [Kiritimatiellia bacterium]